METLAVVLAGLQSSEATDRTSLWSDAILGSHQGHMLEACMLLARLSTSRFTEAVTAQMGTGAVRSIEDFLRAVAPAIDGAQHSADCAK